MHFIFVAFNFQGPDLAAEEKNYFDYHVALTRTLPGLRLYLTGRSRPIRGAAPEHIRTAITGFDSAETCATAMASEAGSRLVADTNAHLKDLRLEMFTAEIVVPFDSGKTGASRFVIATAFDFRREQGDLATAEQRYQARHVQLARRLPDLKGYAIAPLAGPGAARDRMAILMFDGFDQFRRAFRSDAGVGLNRDGEETITNMRFDHIDARTEI